jgi:hypothetical protein
MTTADFPAPPVAVRPVLYQGPYIHWSSIIVGAIAAAALAFVLHSFAVAIGIAVASTSPTWRDSSFALWLLSGLYLLLTAFISYGLGGYIAGRTRAPIVEIASDEMEVRDGGHGLAVWAVATLLTGILVLWAAQSLPHTAPDRASRPSASESEKIIAYDVDKLFRAERRPPGDDLGQIRAEATRILLTAPGHSGMTTEDHNYLVRVVVAQTALSPTDAERRVDAVIASVRDNVGRFRRSTVILGFMGGAAALLGAAVAWFAACAGGRHRDGMATFPMTGWGLRGPRRLV